MTGTEVATTSGGFTGADVDGLDKLAHDFTAAAQVVDMVRTACEVIVAAASFFGPFAAAFIAYLKGTVIPWLTKISEALKAMSKVLSIHSQAQKDTSSSANSLPSYTGTTNLPTTSTTNAPQLGGAVAPATPTTNAPATTGSTVTAPPTIGGSVPAGTSGTTATGTAGSSTPPIVQTITALTGLVAAVDHLIHPGSSPGATTTPTTPVDGTAGTVGGSVPGTTTPITPVDGTTPITTPITTPGTTGEVVSGTGAVLGSPGALGGTGGIDLSTLHPLHPGDTVGVISVPVDIAPDGRITPLVHTPLDPTSSAATSSVAAPSVTAAHAITATPVHSATPSTLGSSGGGGVSGGGGSLGGGGGSFGGDTGVPAATPSAPAAPHPDATLAAHTTPAAEPALHTQRIGSHDGLFSGLGQATGIGAGAAALARAVLHEARQRADGSMAGATPSPFDADSDAAAQSSIFSGAIS